MARNIPALVNSERPILSGSVRVFIAFYDPTPEKRSIIRYMGLLNITSSVEIVRPDPDTIYQQSPLRANQWDIVGEVVKAIEPQTVEFELNGDSSDPRDFAWLLRNNVPFTMYMNVIENSSPQNPSGWASKYVLTGMTMLTFAPLAEGVNVRQGPDNASVQQTGSMRFQYAFETKTVVMSEVGAGTASTDVTGLTFTPNEYDLWYFGTTAAVSTTSPSALLYGTDDGGWTETSITALGTDGDASSINIIGGLIFITSNGAEAHYYSSLNDGVNGNDNFTEVTGYTASSGPNDAHAVHAGNIVIVGDGGYIYNVAGVSNEPTIIDDGNLTTENLNAVHGQGEFVVAVGANNVVLISTDGGETFASVTGPSSGTALNTVFVTNNGTFYIGGGDGSIYFGRYSDVTGDVTYTTPTILSANPPTSINDLQFYQRKGVTGLFGVAVGEDGSDNVTVLRTTTQGQVWRDGTPEVSRVSTALSAPSTLNAAVIPEPNTILVGGGDGSAGTLGAAT